MAAVSTRRAEVHLTPTEGRLLACLVRSAGRIVSHRELMEAISSRDRNVSIGNLRSCVSRLRTKVEIDPGLPRVIITHHKLGYSFAGREEAPGLSELGPS